MTNNRFNEVRDALAYHLHGIFNATPVELVPELGFILQKSFESGVMHNWSADPRYIWKIDIDSLAPPKGIDDR